ncbi:MAG: DUF47 family protein [Thermoplasmata archaeon]|nr:MAG: DUF47 family protein [Thermoplasmata archaeon]
MILEMKDTSELMIDLAYSSLLFNNRKIAEEVYHLEDQIDKLNKKVQLFAITQLSKENPEAALTYIHLASSIEVIADSAREIADVVLREIEPHPILTESIRESEVTIMSIKVNPRSIMCNKPLGKIRLASETGMWVIAIRRRNKMIFGPDENTVIKAGDIMITRGPFTSKNTLKSVAAGKLKKL